MKDNKKNQGTNLDEQNRRDMPGKQSNASESQSSAGRKTETNQPRVNTSTQKKGTNSDREEETRKRSH